MTVFSRPNACPRHPRLTLLALVAVVALGVAAWPGRAYAASPYAHTIDPVTGERTDYIRIDEALADGYTGKVVVMDRDWDENTPYEAPGATIEDAYAFLIEKGQKVTIDMNGHTIKTGLTAMEGAEATLMSSKQATITYDAVVDVDGNQSPTQLTTGGLITNTTGDGTCALCLMENSKVTLDGVAVAGCPDTGVWAFSGSFLIMKNGAVIEHNRGMDVGDGFPIGGGGVYMYGKGSISLDNSFIRNNYANYGGGVLFGTSGSLSMTGGSAIEGNSAWAGGGVYVANYEVSITSSDRNAFIRNNTATGSSGASDREKCGGGIFFEESSFSGGTVDGITISDNQSFSTGGGIQIGRKDITVKNCSITGNSSSGDGGGIHVNNEGATIDGCAITGNYCGGGNEGGGVFVYHGYDISLAGKCVVKNNTRGKDSGNDDDLFLRENTGASAKAYIKGHLDAGSAVGVRTGITGDRRIAEGFSSDAKDVLFIDLNGYYVSYGSDKGGDAWQRHRELQFEAKVNGGSIGRYKWKAKVTANGMSIDARKVFKCWSAEKSTGLYPFSDYVSDADLKNPVVTFAMPQNDVNLVAEYVTRTSAITLTAERPVAGEALPTSGKISWTGVDGAAHEKDVGVSWLVKSGDDWVPTGGTAKYYAEYRAVVSIAQDLDDDIAFAFDIDASKQAAILGGESVGVAAASVDATGTLSMQSNGVTTAKPTVTSVEGVSVTVQEGASESDFRKLLPKQAAARTDAGTAVKLNVSADGGDLTGLIEGGKVKMPADGGAVTVKIPLSETDEVTVPDDKKAVVVTVTVVETEKVKPATPTVDPIDGTYSTADTPATLGEDGSLEVTATCGTDGATIMYRLDTCVDEWIDGTEQACAGPVVLAKAENDQVIYELEVWSVKDGLESDHEFHLYVIDDIQMKTVTVKYADTAVEGAHGSKNADGYTVWKGKSLTLAAPDREGYVFEKWLASDGSTILGTDATLTLKNVSESTEVTAVYNPVVSVLEVEMDAPEAHKALNQAVSRIAATVAGKEGVDITSYFTNGRDNPALSWSPSASGDEGDADHATVYTASLRFESGGVDVNAKYVLVDNATIKFKSGDESTVLPTGSSYISEGEDGVKSVSIQFSVTGPYEYKSTASLSDIELSFADAWRMWGEQDPEHPAWAWGLPDQVEVTYKCGESEPYDISWSSITGFDAGATGAQELTATGTIAFPDYVDHDGPTETVTVKLKVAAPETLEAPRANMSSGTYKGGQEVFFVAAGEDDVIRYTYDGTEPTEDSPVYEGDQFWIENSVTLKARAFRDGYRPSETVAYEYVIQHEVTFDASGGSTVAAQWVNDGEAAAEPAVPTLVGSTFEGWFTEDGKPYDFATPVTEDLTLYAHWSKKGGPTSAHTVTFDSVGGSAVTEQVVADGACAKRPADPVLGGFDFEGWATADGEEYDFSAAVTGDLVLYARWSKSGEAVVAHLVVFDSAGGSRVGAQTVADGGLATEPEAPTRDGYEFAGWTFGGAAYDFGAPVTSDLELVATWKKDDAKKDETKKDDAKKDDAKKDETKKDDAKKDETNTDESKKEDGGSKRDSAKAKVTAAAAKPSSALPGTGDYVPLAAGLLAVLGLLAVVSGILGKRTGE